MTASKILIALFVAALTSVVACSSDDGVVCVNVTEECTPLYEPTFENVFAITLQPGCGVAGTACHSSEGRAGGLVLDEIEAAYTGLTGGNRVRVDPEALGCDILMSRVAAEQLARVMPPGSRLPDAELCSVVQWVAGGAQR